MITTNHFSGWAFGAPLYVPALHPELLRIANAEKIPQLKSMIICTEDAVAEKDVKRSMQLLHQVLPQMHNLTGPYRFIRPRNPEILKQMLDLPGIENIHGFVLPKFNLSNSEKYLRLLRKSNFLLMPTLETADVFDQSAAREMAIALDADAVKPQVALVRIGGNDLLNLLGVRRMRGLTIYESPLSGLISQLAMLYKPMGFSLSAPVYEYLADSDTLDREIRLDIAHGLTGKTAIHPYQIPLIEKHYAVSREDHESALSILDKNRPAVFKMHNAMCEVNTHSNWAQQILYRHACYGYDDNSQELQSSQEHIFSLA
jgi:citrate lyase beta subunit